MAALHITGLMIMPCYFFSGLFLIKKADTPAIKTVAYITTAFCVWMAYAGGLKGMLMTSVFYLLGTGFYIKARRENKGTQARIFTASGRWFLYALCVASAVTVALLAEAFLQ